ncbi:MAG: branched-chain amino acid transport system permease protein [Alphaproteobacteria bacterium]|jgi:branched-chain amino acid transport system permease protein|nr:branched-chain amino acid transport system permease protein [Alphaproteobacteria bacterium]
MISATNFVQLLFSGLAMGAIYALTAKGLFIAHLATARMNFGQGEFLMIAAYLSMALILAGIPVAVSAVVVIAVMGALGWALERFALRPLDRFRSLAGGQYSWVLTTMGVALIIQNVATLVWGKSSQYSPPLFSESRSNVIKVFGVGVFVEELVVIVTALVVVAFFYWFLFRTRQGRGIQAIAFNPEAATLLGVDVRRTVTLVFVLAAVLAGISGILVGPIVTVQPHMGLVFTVKAFAVASLGGFANPLGVLVGALIFGITESFSNYFNSKFGDLIPLIIVLVLLVIKPSGLFGEAKADVR